MRALHTRLQTKAFDKQRSDDIAAGQVMGQVQMQALYGGAIEHPADAARLEIAGQSALLNERAILQG